MGKLKIYCTDSEDAKRKLGILKEYGIDIGNFICHLHIPFYYILDTENIKICDFCVECYRGAKDIPEVCYDFFNLTDEEREKAFRNADFGIVEILQSEITGWFHWSISPEGHSYWDNIRDRIQSKSKKSDICLGKEFPEKEKEISFIICPLLLKENNDKSFKLTVKSKR